MGLSFVSFLVCFWDYPHHRSFPIFRRHPQRYPVISWQVSSLSSSCDCLNSISDFVLLLLIAWSCWLGSSLVREVQMSTPLWYLLSGFWVPDLFFLLVHSLVSRWVDLVPKGQVFCQSVRFLTAFQLFPVDFTLCCRLQKSDSFSLRLPSLILLSFSKSRIHFSLLMSLSTTFSLCRVSRSFCLCLLSFRVSFCSWRRRFFYGLSCWNNDGRRRRLVWCVFLEVVMRNSIGLPGSSVFFLCLLALPCLRVAGVWSSAALLFWGSSKRLCVLSDYWSFQSCWL